MPDHVVAEIAEKPCGHRGEVPGVGHRGFGHQGAKRVDRGTFVGGKAVAFFRRSVDFRHGAAAPPDQVGCKSDNREAAPDFTAFDRLEKKRVPLAGGETEIG